MKTQKNYKDNPFIKIFLKLWKKIDKDDVLSLKEQLAFDIFKICLYDENNVRYLNSGASYKKYIVTKQFVLSKDIGTFIVLESGKITIVNHQYRYDIDMPQKTSQIMNRMFDDKVTEDRHQMEEEIYSNITSSLEIVLANFKEQLQEK